MIQSLIVSNFGSGAHIGQAGIDVDDLRGSLPALLLLNGQMLQMLFLCPVHLQFLCGQTLSALPQELHFRAEEIVFRFQFSDVEQHLGIVDLPDDLFGSNLSSGLNIQMGKLPVPSDGDRMESAVQEGNPDSGDALHHTAVKSPENHCAEKQGNGTEQEPRPASFHTRQRMTLRSAVHLFDCFFRKSNLACHMLSIQKILRGIPARTRYPALVI